MAAEVSFERQVALRCVTLIMAVVVGLTFLFGFGNVWALAVRLGVYPWVAPAVDLSVLGLLQAISSRRAGGGEESAVTIEVDRATKAGANAGGTDPATSESSGYQEPGVVCGGGVPRAGDELLARARQEDARHWAEHQRPISAETLRKRLRVGAARARMLVGMMRADVGRRSSV